MVKKVFSATTIGIDACLIEVEADVINGLPVTNIVGLADLAVKESRERVKSAVKNSGGEYPQTRVSVNLAPADVPKIGSHFDFPIAMAILLASGRVNFDFSEILLLGELALDGTLRPVVGVLSMVRKAKALGKKQIFLPEENANEASLVGGLEIYGFKDLKEVMAHVLGINKILPKTEKGFIRPLTLKDYVDFSEIAGQLVAKRAMVIAAAGGHNLLICGSPGSGKSMLARAMPGILPAMSESEMLEVSSIYSVSGLLRDGLVGIRPFRSPHHTASNIALVGGGVGARPGEITLAHRGVLFLDELPEFSRQSLETLRQPLEDRQITIARAKLTQNYPADFILVGSMNPCPCGYYGDSKKVCSCSLGVMEKYKKKISGPLLDRIDLFVKADRVEFSSMRAVGKKGVAAQKSSEIREVVDSARKIQRERLGEDRLNAQMSLKEIDKFCELDEKMEAFLENVSTHFALSARQVHRILKTARTIADIDGSERIEQRHLAETVQFRS